jgi:hypothetical protein
MSQIGKKAALLGAVLGWLAMVTILVISVLGLMGIAQPSWLLPPLAVLAGGLVLFAGGVTPQVISLLRSVLNG